MIQWMYKEQYEKIVPILGGFHTLLCYLKIMYKKYGCLGFQDWWVDAGAIAEGSVIQAVEGKHYARGLRLHICRYIRQKFGMIYILQNRFGGSISGEPFSTIHGDLITETTINREVKVRGGPMRGGYSTFERTTDAFIKTSHLMAAIRRKLKEKLSYVTSSTHKVNISRVT